MMATTDRIDMSGCDVHILYRNYKGEVAWRHVRPLWLSFRDCQPWHPESQWLLEAYDYSKEADRTFAMKDVLKWQTTAPLVNLKPGEW